VNPCGREKKKKKKNYHEGVKERKTGTPLANHLAVEGVGCTKQTKRLVKQANVTHKADWEGGYLLRGKEKGQLRKRIHTTCKFDTIQSERKKRGTLADPVGQKEGVAGGVDGKQKRGGTV